MKKLVLILVAAIIVLSPISAQALSIGTWNVWPTIGVQLNDKLTGYLGYNYSSNYNNNNAISWALIKLDYNLAKLGEAQTKVGVDYWTSTPYLNSALEFTYGASFMPINNLSVGFDIMLLSLYNCTAYSRTDILSSARASINLYY